MTTVLLTLGRLPKSLDLARGFSRAGCRVLVAEPFPWHLAGASRHVARSFRVPPPSQGKAAYLAALYAIIADEGVDLVVPVSEETMHVAFLRDRLMGRARLFTMPPDQVLVLHDKAGFIRQGEACGVPVPQTHRLGSTGARALAAERDVVVKPVFSCSGRGVRVLRRGGALPPDNPADPAIVQAFVPGRVHSSCTIAHDGRAVATVIYRGTVMSGTVAVAFERVPAYAAITAWINRFVEAAGWSGFISFDFIVADSGEVHGIECNPRATSGVHFWEPKDIAGAILDPARYGGPGGAQVRVRPQEQLQQFYSCLTETQMAVFRRDGALNRLRRLATTKDVTWEWRDPLPFLTMTMTSWRIIALSIARRTTFGEVATLDVGWYEDPPCLDAASPGAGVPHAPGAAALQPRAYSGEAVPTCANRHPL